jgi:L-lactate dehydrogenase complex protein LldG
VARTENSGRERILARIRSGLLTPVVAHTPDLSSGSARPMVFAPIPDALERFQRECAENNTECIVTPDAKGSAEIVAGVLAALPVGEIFVQDAPELRRLAQAWSPSRAIRWSNEGAPAETSQATITLAECLVAQTGSIFVSSKCGGRGASVVAPVHIVVANVGQLVPDLETAFARLRERGTASHNSFVCLITGSSRTSDIEKILVLGAHGPCRLVTVLALHSANESGGGPAKA